jgi:PIN domain nuclease of toxin-antitoxin system
VETVIHLDTHVVAWLYAGRVDLLPSVTRTLLDAKDLAISPMVILELNYLKEIGRTNESGKTVVDDLAARIGLMISNTPFLQIIAAARELSWTRDPFDRIIVGHAIADDCKLITADASIAASFSGAFWS